MNKKEIIKTLLEKNLGYLKTSEVTNAGISRPYLSQYVEKHGLTRVASGLYLAPDAWPDGMYVIQTRYPQAVFSHESALFLLDMAEREPGKHTVTLKSGASTTRLTKDGVKVYRVKEVLFTLGLSEVKSPIGHRLRTYNAERTICDMIRSRNNIETQDYSAALKEYVQKKDRNIPRLMEYAELFSVDKLVLQYLEVLL